MQRFAFFALLAACATPAPTSGGARDLATAARDLGASDAASGALCGNGGCDPGETGASCGVDCCDASTACAQTYANDGMHYCRSMNGGAYDWYTSSQTLAMCSDATQLKVATYACGGESGTCCSLPGGWIKGACP
jgi:hypothetical protein